MPATAIPFVGRPAVSDNPFTARVRRALRAALDLLVPPRDPGRDRDPGPPPEWYRFPPF